MLGVCNACGAPVVPQVGGLARDLVHRIEAVGRVFAASAPEAIGGVGARTGDIGGTAGVGLADAFVAFGAFFRVHLVDLLPPDLVEAAYTPPGRKAWMSPSTQRSIPFRGI